MSNARSITSSGLFPVNVKRKFAANPSSGSPSTSGCPLRRRSNEVTMAAVCDISRSAFSRFAFSELSRANGS